MSRRRRSTEEGHKRKFLVVIDNTDECDRALFFASRRADRSGGALVILTIIPPADFQHWMGVEQIMREEALEEANALIDRAAESARSYATIEPEKVVREGYAAEEVHALIDEDEDIAILVLAAGSDKEGPGPLVTWFANRGAAALSIPVTVVPGTLSNEDLEALS